MTTNPFAEIAALLMGGGQSNVGDGAFQNMPLPQRGAAASGTLMGTIDHLMGVPTNERIQAGNSERVRQDNNQRADRGLVADQAFADAFQAELRANGGNMNQALTAIMKTPAFSDAFSHGSMDKMIQVLTRNRALNTPTPPLVVQTPEGGRTELVDPSNPTAPGRVITNPRAPAPGAAELETDKVRVRRGAQMLDRVGQEGDQATRALADLTALEGVIARTPGGTMTGLRSVAASYGLPVEGASDLQLAQAIIGRLAPAQRTPGVGPMSDFETRSLMATIPNAWQSPEGRRSVARQMRTLAEHSQARGEIANRFYSGRLTLTETFEALDNQERKFVRLMEGLRKATGSDNTLEIAPGIRLRPR